MSDWLPGGQIILTSTSWNPWELDLATISFVSVSVLDGKNVTYIQLEESLDFNRDGNNLISEGLDFQTFAEVGYLSSGFVIKAADGFNQYFGSSVRMCSALILTM